MKNFFEAIIYLAFPIILILSICSLGFRSLMTWAQFLIWISLWPPFFVIVNFLLNTTWDLRINKLFGTSEVGLTLFSSSGLGDLYSSMESIAAGALFSVPFLAFAIVKGGVSSMIHLAGTLNAPAQGAANQAAGEQVSGNYSIGNFSYGNENFSSKSMMKWDETPALSQGAMTHKSGTLQTTLGDDGALVLDKPQGNFGTDINASQVYGQGINAQYNESTNQMRCATESVNQAFQSASNSGISFMNALSQDHSFSHLQSNSDQDSALELYNKTEQQITDFSENYGVSRSQVVDAGARLHAGLDIKGFGVGGSFSTNAALRDDTGEQVAKRDSELVAINKNIQTLQQYTDQHSQTENLSSTQKASQDYSEQLSKTESWMQQYQDTLSENKVWSDLKQQYESQDLSAKQSLSNEFSSYIMGKYNDISVVDRLLENPQKMSKEIQDFTWEKQQEMIQSNKHNKLNVSELSGGFKGLNDVPKYSKTTLKGSQIKEQVMSSASGRLDIQRQYDGLKGQMDKHEKSETQNIIQAKTKIAHKKETFNRSKVTEERKEQLKYQAENETVAEQSGQMVKDIGGGIGKIAKKTGKLFTDGKKPIGFE